MLDCKLLFYKNTWDNSKKTAAGDPFTGIFIGSIPFYGNIYRVKFFFYWVIFRIYSII